MKKIAILRGINVGGRRKILMADLRQLCQDIGLKNVETYIQSGNVIFDAALDPATLETQIAAAIQTKFGYDVPVIVRTAEDLRRIYTNNPFVTSAVDPKHLHVTLLKEMPTSEHVTHTETYDFAPDKFSICDQEVYLYCPGGYHSSKITNTFFEKKLNIPATTRNWKTITKLATLSQPE